MAASPLDVTKFTERERKAARKDLLKKIEHYNKQTRKTREPSFPISSPTKDLKYKGILKITYDRGYAVQTKSMLVESTTTSIELIEQLIDTLGLTGGAEDYVLEERNLMTNEFRPLKRSEHPLGLHLQYGPHCSYLEIRLVQVRDSRMRHYHTSEESDSDEDVGQGKSHNLVPKDEVVDHGTANVEITMEEVLQDFPPLICDIKERLRLLSESVSEDGKPRVDIPVRRALWDALKPQVSSLVKDIRHLVDSGEFMVTRHCPSPECRLIVTLLLELITDYSRELITVTKEMCGMKGGSRVSFSTSVGNFVQQITYISKLVGKTVDSLHAAALTGHLLYATAPENFLKGPMSDDSLFTGSGSISGVLVFTIVTSYLGLIRAAYDEKTDYYAALAENMLQSTRRALETIQKTNEYALLHLHPLRTRVTDMEHKLKVAMDTLVTRLKITSSKRTPPDAVPEILLSGHNLIVCTLDFLMVAQLASLLHKVVIVGWELLQMPWVRGWVTSSTGKSSDGDEPKAAIQAKPPHVHGVDNFSSIASTTSGSTGSPSTVSSGQRKSRERKSRIPANLRKSTDGEGEESLATGTRASHVLLNYSIESGEDADDEAGRSGISSSRKLSDEVATSISDSHSGFPTSPAKPLAPHLFGNGSKYMGIDAVKKLRQHYKLNKAITKVAEGLLLTVTQKVNMLQSVCQDKARDKYALVIDNIVTAAKQIREEVSAMEADVLGGQSMQESLRNSQAKMDTAIRDVYLSLTAASGAQANDKDRMRLIASVSHLSDISSKTVGDALATISEHKKALAQAEKLEEEFMSLMTGKSSVTRTPSSSEDSHGTGRKQKKVSLPRKYSQDSDSEGLLFEESEVSKPFSPGGVWMAKTTPRVIGGSLMQLIQRVTYHRIVDPEFVETFVLAFHCFIPPSQLLDAIIDRYTMKSNQELNDIEQEAFDNDIVIPVRLRIMHILRLWLRYHHDDFKNGDGSLRSKLEVFLDSIEDDFNTCAKQLRAILNGEQCIPKKATLLKQTSQPIIPSGSKVFELLDANTLELARQLCILFSKSLQEIKLKELLTLGWEDDSKAHLIPDIILHKTLSRNLSLLVSETVLKEPNEEEQSFSISYFIKTAQSCHALKNYEAASAIVQGLLQKEVKQVTPGAWTMLSESDTETFKVVCEAVFPEMNYHRYRMELRGQQMVPCVPLLDVVLKDMSTVQKESPSFIPGKNSILNFQKWRQMAKIMQTFHQQQNCLYSLIAVEVIQNYLKRLQKSSSETKI